MDQKWNSAEEGFGKHVLFPDKRGQKLLALLLSLLLALNMVMMSGSIGTVNFPLGFFNFMFRLVQFVLFFSSFFDYITTKAISKICLG